MQEMEIATSSSAVEVRRVEAVVQTLANMGNGGEILTDVAHEARNMVTALGIYCDLLGEPGVLTTQFAHYGSELKLVAAASRSLAEKLVLLDNQRVTGDDASVDAELEANSLLHTGSVAGRRRPETHWEPMQTLPIQNLAEELLANRNLLAALAGPAIRLTVSAEGAEQPVQLTSEDLIRILVNLVKNAAEAMPAGGSIRVDLREGTAEAGARPRLMLTIEDNGPGIPCSLLKRVFDRGFTTRSKISAANVNDGQMGARRGLGLAIIRSIVEAAGGQIHVANRDPAGACFQIELPVATC